MSPNGLSPPSDKTHSFTPGTLGIILALTLIHLLVALHGVKDKSATSDEPAHLTGGYTFDALNDYRMHPENGILPQRLHALPAILSGARPPALDNAAWREADVWRFARIFMRDSGNDGDAMLFYARAINTVFSASVVLLVAVFAWLLAGRGAALIAATFAASCTTLLAHGPLATSDMAMTLFWLASPLTWWWHLRTKSPSSLAVSSGCFALACVAKFSAVLLPPVLTALTIAYYFIKHPAPTVHSTCLRRVPLVVAICIHALAGWIIIWAFFGFRYSAQNPALPMGAFSLPWEYIQTGLGFPGAIIAFSRSLHLLPEGYLYGLAYVLKNSEARGAFLDGAYSIHGWFLFFPKALLYKTTPALLAAATLGAGLWCVVLFRRPKQTDLNANAQWLWPLLLPYAAYWMVSLASNLNIGHRHILPTYPALYIMAGCAGALAWHLIPARRRRFQSASVLTLLVLIHITAAIRIHPHHLAYFSPIVGGPQNGYRHLVDSSLDWGQDLPGLRDWLTINQRTDETTHLAYFGTDDPEHHGIYATHLPSILDLRSSQSLSWPVPGLYAVSATMLQQVYLPVRGLWTLENEAEYQTARALAPYFRQIEQHPTNPSLLKLGNLETWTARWRRFEILRFARLCHYLRSRQPDANVGYSILIYRLTQNELDDALEGPWSRLVTAIERNQHLNP